MLLLVAALSAAASLPAQANRSSTGDCRRATAQIVVDRGKGPLMRKLNELPPANAYKAVYRLIGGCEVPVVVRYKVGRQ